MSAIAKPTFTPGSEHWHEQRRACVGGSEIAAILGLSRWDSRFSLWHRKQGAAPEQVDNPGMEWGRRLEAVIADKYAEQHPECAVRPGGTFVRADRPWMLASPDRRLVAHGGADASGLLEVKTDHFGDEWGEPGTDQVPIYYRAQVRWYLDVLDLDWCDVAVLIGGSDYREYRVHADPVDAELMRREARAFLDTIERRERPDIDAHTATYQVIRSMHPDIEPDDVELGVDVARTYCTARAALKDAKATEQQAASLVADAMGNARRATFAGDTIATRQARGDGTPYLVAGRNLPDFDPKAA